MTCTELIIGNQIWMSENSDITTFRNGDEIPLIHSSSDWLEASNKKLPACCDYPVFGGPTVNCGKLYNWHAINDIRGFAPEGWRIPSLSDFNSLKKNTLGNSKFFMTNIACSADKTGNKDNQSAFLGGTRDFKGTFLNFGEFGFWWTSDVFNSDSFYAYGFDVNSQNNSIFSFYTDKGDGLSVRLIRKSDDIIF